MKFTLHKLLRPILLVMCLMTTLSLYAQNVTVKGSVTSSSDKSTQIGVSVVIEGTTKGVVTDLDGNFQISAKVGDVLKVSYVGFITQHVTVSAGITQLSIALDPDLVALDEVVVIGYGTIKKSDMTGAVVSVSSDEINRKPSASIEQALQGIAAGVQVTNNGGSPGDGAVIRIRGVGSVNNTNPLYVIDGVPVEGSGSTNPSDIETINVLKDAAACAIYGSRGANGVIIITTKKGKTGFHIGFESQFGVQKEWKRLDLLNSEEYAKYINEVAYNAKRTAPKIAQDPFNQSVNTDWQEEMFRLAPIQKYNLSISGGSKHVNYNFSGGYLDQQGIMLGTSYKKYYFRNNAEATFGKLKFGVNVAYNNSDKQNETQVGGRTQVERMITETPNVPVYDATQKGGYAGPTTVNDQDAVNPVGVANLYYNHSFTTGVLGNIYGEYEIIDGLKYKLSYGIDDYWGVGKYREVAYQMGDYQKIGDPKKSNQYDNSFNSILENLLTYDKDIDFHHFNIIAGYSQERRSFDTHRNEQTYYSVKDSIGFSPVKLNKYNGGIVSYLGRVNYSYDEKYLAQINFRRDGSSKFGEKNRWGIFPSYSLGWVVSKEAFMQSLPVVSFMKLRGSWGKIGNQNIDDYQYEASLNSFQNYVFNNEVYKGIGPRGFANPYVKWESAVNFNVGTDVGFFNNKLNVTVEYFENHTTDMLIKVTLPESNGSSVFPFQNAGSVTNKGYEFILNYKNWDNEFKYSVTGNLSKVFNEVTDLGVTDAPIYDGGSELGQSTKTEIGHPIGSFYGYKTNGIYKNASEIDKKFAPNAKVGDIRFVDLDGNGVLNDKDRTYIGSSIPDWSYGFNVSASYKNIDLSLSLQGVYGVDIYRETKVWTEGMYSNFNASTAVNNRYRASDITITTGPADHKVNVDYKANTNTNMPWAVKNDLNKNAGLFSDRFIEDGSYLRLKDLTIGYSFSDNVAKRMKLAKLRVYFVGVNLLTFTDYQGYDPEVGGSNLSRGIDNGVYPQPKSFMGGIQLSF